MIPFILGVTGHRYLPVKSLATIEHGVRERLRELQRKLPDTRIIVASALAEGADRLVAQVALEEVSSYGASCLPVLMNTKKTSSRRIHEQRFVVCLRSPHAR